jgi:hypothetical protein
LHHHAGKGTDRAASQPQAATAFQNMASAPEQCADSRRLARTEGGEHGSTESWILHHPPG